MFKLKVWTPSLHLCDGSKYLLRLRSLRNIQASLYQERSLHSSLLTNREHIVFRSVKYQRRSYHDYLNKHIFPGNGTERNSGTEIRRHFSNNLSISNLKSAGKESRMDEVYKNQTQYKRMLTASKELCKMNKSLSTSQILQAEQCMQYWCQKEHLDLLLSQGLYDKVPYNLRTPRMYIYLMQCNVRLNFLSPKFETTQRATDILFLYIERYFGHKVSSSNKTALGTKEQRIDNHNHDTIISRNNLTEILNTLQDHHKHEKDVRQLRTLHFTKLIICWSKLIESASSKGEARSDFALKQAESILDLLLTLYQKYRYEELKPIVNTFTSIVQAHCKLGNLKKAEHFLMQMQQYEVSNDLIVEGYEGNSKDDAELQSGDLYDGNDILFSMMKNCKADTYIHNIVLIAYAKRGLLRDLERILKTMEENNVPLDIYSYAAWIEGACKEFQLKYAPSPKNRNKLGEKVEMIWGKIKENSSSSLALQPKGIRHSANVKYRNNMTINTVLYNQMLKAWNICQEPERAEQVLSSMIRENVEEGNVFVKPDILSFNTTLSAWAKSGKDGSVERAHSILNSMPSSIVQPDTTSYNIVLDAYARNTDIQPHYALEAQSLLDSMKSRNNVFPDAISFNTVMKAWVRSKRMDACEKANGILMQLEDEELNRSKGELHNNVQVRPDDVSYLMVISAYAYRGDYINAQRTYDKLVQYYKRNLKEKGRQRRIHNNCRNALINAYAKSSQRDANAAHAAQSILEKSINSQNCLTEQQEQVDKSFSLSYPPPDVITFSTVINAWAYSNDPFKARRAHDVLKMLENLFREGDKSLKQNLSNARELRDLHNLVLTACTFTSSVTNDKERLHDSFVIAKELMGNMMNRMGGGEGSSLILMWHPNSKTYATFLQICARSSSVSSLTGRSIKGTNDTSMEYDTLLKTTFEHCCRNGMLNKLVLSTFVHAASKQLFNVMFGKQLAQKGRKIIEMHDLPKSWTRNVSRR